MAETMGRLGGGVRRGWGRLYGRLDAALCVLEEISYRQQELSEGDNNDIAA